MSEPPRPGRFISLIGAAATAPPTMPLGLVRLPDSEDVESTT